MRGKSLAAPPLLVIVAFAAVAGKAAEGELNVVVPFAPAPPTPAPLLVMCAVTAVLYHQFWRYPDFWRFREGEGLQHFWEFLKNFGLVGGLGLVMLAPHTLPLSTIVQHPLASTYVSGPEASTPAP